MPTRALANLERIKDRYDGASVARKLALLRVLERTRLGGARQVERLHEALCFLRAYPDDVRVAGRVERMLARFAGRADLKIHREALAGSGIAGTTIRYCFFWPTARWLAQRWPGAFRLDRDDGEAGDNIAGALPLLVTPARAMMRTCGTALIVAVNENALGLSPKSRAAMKELLEVAWQYPGESRRLVHDAIASSHGLEKDHILLANGSSELLRGGTRSLSRNHLHLSRLRKNSG